MANTDPKSKGNALRSEPKAVIFNGVLVPDADSIRSMLYTLNEKMKRDAELAQRFQADPRRVLGDLGLNAEIQLEVMKSQGIEIPAGGCPITCVYTCSLTEARH